MTATEQASQEQPPVTGSSTTSMEVGNSNAKAETEVGRNVSDGLNDKPAEVIELPPEDDDFGGDVLVFDDGDVMDDCTNSLLKSVEKEMSKQGIEVSGGDSNSVQTAPQEPSDIALGASEEPSGQQESVEANEETVEEQTPLLEDLPLQELITIIKEEAKKKFAEPEEKFAKRFDQMTKIIDDIQALENGRESSTVKKRLAIKIEEIQISHSVESAVKQWRCLIEDLDSDLKMRKSIAQKRNADKEKVQELKKLKQPIPKELTKKGHAKIMAEIAQAQKEIRKLRQKINKLKTKELSLDDMNSEKSVYLKEGELTKKHNNLLKKVTIILRSFELQLSFFL